MKLIIAFLISSLFVLNVNSQSRADEPNILLIIADDIGVDMINGYGFGGLKPNTPTLDSLRSEGLTFENVWSAPACTPTRAAIMSGKHGVKTGVLKAPGHLDTAHSSVFNELKTNNSGYNGAVVGKWHIANPVDLNHPSQHKIDYYVGEMGALVRDYRNWDKTYNGATTVDTNYVTSVFTDSAINWINTQKQPWLMWLAHVAPHSPFHEPPAEMYSISSTTSNFRKYVAMMESVDFELNRLIYSIPDSVRKNTVIIFVGDNGTPGNFTQDYPSGHGKGTLYEGGIRVPMVIAGAGVTRKGEREKAMVHVCDIYATLIELAGTDLPGGKYNGLSFKPLLTDANAVKRRYNYSEIESTVKGWTIRDEEYKLIEFSDGTQEFYNLLSDSLEMDNLISKLDANQSSIKSSLESEASARRTGWSCQDQIQNGDESGIDCGGSSCLPCGSSIDEKNNTSGILVFPNPAKDRLTVQRNSDLPATALEIVVSNLLGKVLVKEMIQPELDQLEIDLSAFDSQTLIISSYKISGDQERILYSKPKKVSLIH